MTIYGWDASHYDWDRGPMDLAAARRDGISFMTHKIGEARTVTDDRFDDFYRRARGAALPLLGAYYVNHPGDQAYQADRFLALLDARASGWRESPFILQVDAEKFDYMNREPSPAECRAFCDRLVARTGGAFRPILYGPRWLYGDRLSGVGYPLWASAYGANPTGRYRSVYPGDGSSRWAPYSGQVPVILQYGSRTRIGTQHTCDANAFRGTLAQLRDIVYRGSGSNDMSIEDVTGGLDTPLPFRSEGVGNWARAEGWGDVSPRALLEYAFASTAKTERMLVAALAAIEGLDTAAILARIDEHAATEARRDADAAAERAELRALVEQGLSGELAAEEVVRLIGERLRAA